MSWEIVVKGGIRDFLGWNGVDFAGEKGCKWIFNGYNFCCGQRRIGIRGGKAKSAYSGEYSAKKPPKAGGWPIK